MVSCIKLNAFYFIYLFLNEIYIMSSRIETLIINSATIMNGWMKTITSDNKVFRTMRIGSIMNCNEDHLICDHTTEDKIKDVMKKYNIEEFVLNNIHNQFEYSTEIVLTEDVYTTFINNLLNLNQDDSENVNCAN